MGGGGEGGGGLCGDDVGRRGEGGGGWNVRQPDMFSVRVIRSQAMWERV